MTTIPNVEIFATGTWRGSHTMEVTVADLDAIVASYNELGTRPGFQPFLKLGHGADQRFIGQKKGAPNLGFVENVRRMGDKVLADFTNVPQALVDLIRNRRYNTVSIELKPTYEFAGKVYRNVLYAVALLGAEWPAVKDLKELSASLFEDDPSAAGVGEVALFEEQLMTTYSQEQLDSLIKAARAEEKAAVAATFTEQVTALTRERDDFKGKSERADKALRTFEAAQHSKDIERLVDDAIKEGKLLPKQKAQAIQIAHAMPGTMKFGDKEQDGAKAFAEFIKGFGKAVDTKERGAAGDKTEFADAGDEVDKKAQALVDEGKAKTYAEARQKVLAANPDLKVRYFNQE